MNYSCGLAMHLEATEAKVVQMMLSSDRGWSGGATDRNLYVSVGLQTATQLGQKIRRMDGFR